MSLPSNMALGAGSSEVPQLLNIEAGEGGGGGRTNAMSLQRISSPLQVMPRRSQRAPNFSLMSSTALVRMLSCADRTSMVKFTDPEMTLLAPGEFRNIGIGSRVPRGVPEPVISFQAAVWAGWAGFKAAIRASQDAPGQIVMAPVVQTSMSVSLRSAVAGWGSS